MKSIIISILFFVAAPMLAMAIYLPDIIVRNNGQLCIAEGNVSGQDKICFVGSAGLSADANLTLPTSTGTLASDSNTLTFTGKTIDADGSGNSITNIENADIKSGADIARNKLASGTADHVLINDGSGVMSSEAQLTASRGGTGQDTSADTGIAHVSGGTWSVSAIVDADVDASAAIDASKIADGTVSNTEYQYLSGVTSGIQSQIDNIQTDTLSATGTVTYTFIDEDTTDNDPSVTTTVNCTDTGSGTEDCDYAVNQQIAGTLTEVIDVDADGEIQIPVHGVRVHDNGSNADVPYAIGSTGNVGMYRSGSNIRLSTSGIDVLDGSTTTMSTGSSVSLKAAKSTQSATVPGLFGTGGSTTGISMITSNIYDIIGGATITQVDANGLSIHGQDDLRLYDSTTTNYMGFEAPSSVTSSVTLTLPDGDGSNGQFMTTDGAGTLSWSSAGSNPASGLTSGYIPYADGANGLTEESNMQYDPAVDAIKLTHANNTALPSIIITDSGTTGDASIEVRSNSQSFVIGNEANDFRITPGSGAIDTTNRPWFGMTDNSSIDMRGQDDATALDIVSTDTTVTTDLVFMRFTDDADIGGTSFISFQDSDGEIGRVENNGGAAVAYQTLSDARLKQNARPLDDGYEKLKQLKPKYYEWKENGTEDQGFIAQEIKKVWPYVVSGDEDGDEKHSPMGVDYGKMTPLLVSALQKSIEKIEALEAKVANLEARTGFSATYTAPEKTVDKNEYSEPLYLVDGDETQICSGDKESCFKMYREKDCSDAGPIPFIDDGYKSYWNQDTGEIGCRKLTGYKQKAG